MNHLTPIFDGTIDAAGKLALDKRDKFLAYLHSLAGKRVQVIVEKLKRTRSNNQNRYYWGVVVKLIAQHTGHDSEQIHELLKQMFSPKWQMVVIVEDKMREVSTPTSTTRLDTLAFEEYLDRCRLWAQDFLGVTIPLPGEVVE